MPEDKPIEQRLQTQQKLELMSRYWLTWSFILAKARDNPFCPSRLWMVDTHGGRGIHDSEGSPDGAVPGTPLQAVLSARATQRAFPGVTVGVRTSDNHKGRAKELEVHLRRYRGDPPDLVDVRVEPTDWVKQVPAILDEIATEDHPHGGRRGARLHEHRSLWFIDPYGIDGIDHTVISALPRGAEVIINFDSMTAVRFAARAIRGEPLIEDILERAYGGPAWRGVDEAPDNLEAAAGAFAATFSRRFRFRRIHPLRATGSQVRYMVHLADPEMATKAFAAAVRRGLRAGTVIAGRLMSRTQKEGAAKRLSDLFRGQCLTLREMHEVGLGLDLAQLRQVCSIAAETGYGDWDPDSAMAWFDERSAQPMGPAGQSTLLDD